jgi:NAD(P)-dependent dehydrogenase (short-subunit alcohol dehydrogenase family)
MVHSEDGTAHLQYSVDVRDEASVAELFADIARDHRRLNILVNNAGIGGASNLAELDARHYDEVMDTNVRGMLLCTKYAIKLIEAAGGGSVINIASLGSFIGLPGSASYCASKGAVVAFTREAALELAPSRIRVNAVAPGYIDNDMFHRYIGAQSDPAVALAQTVADIPLGRLGTNDDVAAAVAFLASQDAQWITGATLTVDGGTLCR